MSTLEVKKFLFKDWLAIAFLLIPIILTLILWNQLPERFAIHWGLDGEANGFQGKTAFLISLIGINLFVYGLLAIVPYIDPKSESERMAGPLGVIRLVTMAFLALVMSAIPLKAVGVSIDIILLAKLAIIVLYLVLGNQMSKFPPNYFAGIRTPWTLEKPEVWRQVHRWASKLWVACSLLLLLFVFRLDHSTYNILFIVITAILIFFPIIHSYILYRKLEH